MIELPESHTLAKQLTHALKGKKIQKTTAGHSPHRFAFFTGDGQQYDGQLRGKTVGESEAHGGHVEMQIEEMRMDFSDGIRFKLLEQGEKRPAKHQLLIEFEDGTALAASVQMYGGLAAFREGENDNPYYLTAREKISPLADGFDADYFRRLMEGADQKKTSAKAFLATEQRIPGLGNGVLQDILWRAKLHPKKKLADLSGQEIANLFLEVKSVLREMTEAGGRDTERDLYGRPGGYATVMSKNNTAMICPACGAPVKREAFLGGNVYFCTQCQRL